MYKIIISLIRLVPEALYLRYKGPNCEYYCLFSFSAEVENVACSTSKSHIIHRVVLKQRAVEFQFGERN